MKFKYIINIEFNRIFDYNIYYHWIEIYYLDKLIYIDKNYIIIIKER
jgi:hypothetical protein